jgi:hypothetical protein
LKKADNFLSSIQKKTKKLILIVKLANRYLAKTKKNENLEEIKRE